MASPIVIAEPTGKLGRRGIILYPTTKATKSTRVRSIARIVRKIATQNRKRNLMVALSAVVAVVISILSAPGIVGIFGAALALLMLTIAVIDWRSFVIPDALNASGLCLGLMHAVAREPDNMVVAVAMAVVRGALIALVFLAIRYLYARIRGREGLGLGDIKLAAVAGAWLDWPVIPIAIEVAAFVALAIYALRQLVLGRPISATSRLPFGLFFAPAIWICWLIETTVLAAL
jgi:leader peptidase (prepilin peptidase)/N-methyltransferase